MTIQAHFFYFYSEIYLFFIVKYCIQCNLMRFQNSSQTHLWEGFLLFGNFSFTTPSSGWVSVPNSCLSFGHLYFVLPPFKENGLPFWVPGVLPQHSEVVLWKLFSIQMIFWWICGGESGLPVLFLCYLGTAVWLILFGIVLSRFIHFVANGKISFFFWKNIHLAATSVSCSMPGLQLLHTGSLVVAGELLVAACGI